MNEVLALYFGLPLAIYAGLVVFVFAGWALSYAVNLVLCMISAWALGCNIEADDLEVRALLSDIPKPVYPIIYPIIFVAKVIILPFFMCEVIGNLWKHKIRPTIKKPEFGPIKIVPEWCTNENISGKINRILRKQ